MCETRATSPEVEFWHALAARVRQAERDGDTQRVAKLMAPGSKTAATVRLILRCEACDDDLDGPARRQP